MLEYFHNLCYPINRIGVSKGGEVYMEKVNIFTVANFFLNIVDRDSGSTITPLKLQKILYYAQGVI